MEGVPVVRGGRRATAPDGLLVVHVDVARAYHTTAIIMSVGLGGASWKSWSVLCPAEREEEVGEDGLRPSLGRHIHGVDDVC